RAQVHEVGIERIFDVHAQRSGCTRVFLQRSGQVAVDLNDIQGLRTAQQLPGQCAASGADLYDALARGGRYAVDDAADDARIVQEVLTKALTNRNAQTGSLALASSMARARAARRLPVSALPVRARLRAVPWSTLVRKLGNTSVMV